MVAVLVTRTVETVGTMMTEVFPPTVSVEGTEQLVTVACTTSVVYVGTVE